MTPTKTSCARYRSNDRPETATKSLIWAIAIPDLGMAHRRRRAMPPIRSARAKSCNHGTEVRMS